MRSHVSSIIPIIIAAVLAQILWIGIMAQHDFGSFFDYSSQINPDARHYYILARNMVENGIFSRSAQPPYVLDPIRTPGYPALIAFGMLLGCNAVSFTFAVQVVLYIVSVLLLYAAVARVVNEKVAFIAALLMSIDATCHSLCYELMTETLYLFLLVLIFWLCARYASRPSRLAAAFTGAAAAALIYVRPSGLYLALIIVPLFIGFIDMRSKAFPFRALTSLLVILLACAPWVARNAAVFGFAKMSIIDDINLAYATGASIYAEKFGLSLDDARNAVSRDYGLPSYPRMMNAGIRQDEYRVWAAKDREAGMRIVVSNPAVFLKSSAISCVKSMIGHSVNYQAYRMGREFVPFGMGTIARLDWKALANSWHRNGTFLSALFLYEIAFNGFVMVTFVVGLFYSIVYWRAGLIGNKHAFVLLVVVLVYLFAVAASMGAMTYYRFRAPNMPFVFVFSAMAITAMFRDRERR